ncbi:MAG: ABC transporter permease, partial [Acetatifactor sp.]
MNKHSGELTMQEYFITTHKRQRRLITSYRFLIMLFFLILWEVSADLGIIDSFFFSSPSRVVLQFIKL